jgi:hypothetical protein
MVVLILVYVGMEDVYKEDIVGFVEVSFQMMRAITNPISKVDFCFVQAIVSMAWMSIIFGIDIDME